MGLDATTVRKLWLKFKPNSLWTVAKDRFYEKKVLRVTSIDRVGITFEDDNETLGNRLSTKVKYCWGWPPIKHHLENGTLRAYKPLETAQAG